MLSSVVFGFVIAVVTVFIVPFKSPEKVGAVTTPVITVLPLFPLIVNLAVSFVPNTKSLRALSW